MMLTRNPNDLSLAMIRAEIATELTKVWAERRPKAPSANAMLSTWELFFEQLNGTDLVDLLEPLLPDPEPKKH